MMRRQSLFIAVCLLMMGGGCLSASPRPVVGSVTPVVAPTLALPSTMGQATPIPVPTSTATLEPLNAQQLFSTTLQIRQGGGDPRTDEVNGLLYLPADYGRDAQRDWPLIVFLHDSSERGHDPQRLTSIGLPQILQSRSDLPFVVVSPQLPPGDTWNDKGGLITALVAWVKTQYAIDPTRIYLTGFSMGGYGTWALGLGSPDQFAALVPVAGGWLPGSEAVPANICDLAPKPVWVFHGAQDEAVRPAQSEVLVNALRACGGDVRFTLLPQTAHAASGVLPYTGSELYDWLLQQSLPDEEPSPSHGSPIETAAPGVISTPLSGDGSLRPLGQHSYTIDLNITGTKDLTRTATISYLLYLPGGYGQNPQQRWPLVLYLHGSDVWGNDPEDLIASGLPRLLTSTLDFPAIVLSPQAPEDKVWWGAQLDEVSALLDQIQTEYAVDAKRIYLTGLSTGGFGVWALAVQYPRRFAALAPVAGGWNSENDTIPRTICDIKDVPIWVFHGAQDDIVLPRKSQLMVDALKKCGVEVRFTLYLDADHRESFKRAYDDPGLYAWMFEQHLP